MRFRDIQPKKLVVFDIDDTLVHTQTKVHVVKDGKVVNSLNSHDFTHYKLQPGESFDFEDFRNAREFFEKSRPIIPMMRQLKQDIATGNKVVMVTARADFDDKELFLDTFRKYGIDIDKVHVYRAGNSKQGTTEERKKAIIKSLLDKDDYSKAIMYDDAKPNLHTFIELKKDHPRTRFYAWHVSPEGEASEYMREEMNLDEKKRRKKKLRWAAYGPGPYGGYGYAVGYSGAGDAGASDGGGGVGETIRKVKSGYRLVSGKGKNLGTYPSKAGAEKRERQVQYFKHVGEASYPGNIGMMELIKFMQKAGPQERAILQQLIAKKDYSRAWALIQGMTGVKLQGKEFEDQHPNDPPLGPETKPTMPRGTVRVDISDIYDWYKLGMHISNLKGLGKHDFGKGAPSTILSFGSEEEEHEYIDALMKTGLTTTDIDPAGHKKRKGQKVDPTYNVESKIKLSTDPNWYGAEVGDYKATGPVVNIPANQLVGFEPDDKMNQPKSKANVEKIVAGLKQGDKLPPLLVRKYKNGYQVLDGHHRFWAYKLLGTKSIPAQIVPSKDIEEIGKEDIQENFADGKKPGRKGLAKRSGVDCGQSISKLRSIAKSSSGERQRMAHWCANMKSGKKK